MTPSGYSNPRPFEGTSIPQINAVDAKRLVESENALIVDVREADEWSAYRIPGAVHVALSGFMARAQELPRDRPLVMQCASGARSLQAAGALLKMGYENVSNLQGGIMGWHQAGYVIDQG